MIGRVKHFNKEKGFGFIIGIDNKDYFYHISDVRDYRLVEIGDEVEFEVSQNAKGKTASNIIKSTKATLPQRLREMVKRIDIYHHPVHRSY